jgi:hypothetical protein
MTRLGMIGLIAGLAVAGAGSAASAGVSFGISIRSGGWNQCGSGWGGGWRGGWRNSWDCGPRFVHPRPVVWCPPPVVVRPCRPVVVAPCGPRSWGPSSSFSFEYRQSGGHRGGGGWGGRSFSANDAPSSFDAGEGEPSGSSALSRSDASNSRFDNSPVAAPTWAEASRPAGLERDRRAVAENSSTIGLGRGAGVEPAAVAPAPAKVFAYGPSVSSVKAEPLPATPGRSRQVLAQVPSKASPSGAMPGLPPVQSARATFMERQPVGTPSVEPTRSERRVLASARRGG